jgi:hypothetical protein
MEKKRSKMARYINATPLPERHKESLIDAYWAVQKTPGAWEWLKRPDVPGDGGFTYSDDVMVILIKNNMKLFGRHSNTDFANIMRDMEMVAKYGWNRYLLSFNLTPACHCRSMLGEVVNWCGVAGGGVPACEH